jgi:hypothetical protein
LGAYCGAACRRTDHAPRADAGEVVDVDEPPPVPIGFDAYRAWDRMFQIRVGTRTYMASTYDRAGGNEGADASHFLRQESSAFHVTLDVEGPGVLYFVRTNHWHGSPWHYVIDGRDQLVTESSTADPLHPVSGAVFMPQAQFPEPLAYTWSSTRGADLNWVPMAFTRSLTLAYERTHYGTGYYIYQRVPEGASNLSQPIASYRAEPAPSDVLALLGRAGDDIAPHGSGSVVHAGRVAVPAHAARELATLSGAGRIVALKLWLPRERALAASEVRLRIHWDGRAEASVDAPLALFFGAGTLFNRNDAEWLVRGLLVNIHFDANEVRLATYLPMPFATGARIELVGADEELRDVRYEIRSRADARPQPWAAHFHATYRDHASPIPGQDLLLLRTADVEGGGDFCGSFVGTSFIFSDRAELTTLEGDPRFFFDDSESPQAYGTGTEEWAGGGDYWGGENMTLPLAGHPVGAVHPLLAQNSDDQIESAYRFLLADAMPFGKNARIQLEHGGSNESSEHYRSVVYWYGRPGACLTQTDMLHVGDESDENAHGYVSESASPVQTVQSRYELSVDHLGGVELTPETTDTGRFTRGSSEFSVALRPDNFGVLLRRKLDYAFADQRAQVFVADDQPDPDWQSAGVWYLAGSNRCVYSNPAGELDPPEPLVQTSNRRFREDEFLIARELTRGRTRIRLRFVFTPQAKPLLPGESAPESAWSELRYGIYSFVRPQ